MTKIDDVIDGFYEACSDAGRLVDAVAAAHGFFRSSAGGLFVHTLNQSTGRMATADTAIALGYEPARLQEHWEHYYALNPMFHLAKRLGTGTVFTEGDTARVQAGRNYHDSEFYNDWAGPQNLHHAMGEFVERHERGVLVMSVWRSKSEGAFDLEERNVFARLNRHVARAVDLTSRLQIADAEMSALLERSSKAVVTLHKDGRPRHWNARADRLFANGFGLRLREGRLRTAISQDQAALDRLIDCALTPRMSRWAETAVVPVRCVDGHATLLIRISLVSGRLAPFSADRFASAILTIEDPEADAALIDERLKRRFGLTSAQTRIARQLLEGKSASEAASALGLSVETVRTHLKRLFERTDTNRQAELVLKLRSEIEASPS